MNWAQIAALASLLGTGLTVWPTFKAALYLYYRGRSDDAPQESELTPFLKKADARLEQLAQRWHPGLFYCFVGGVICLLISAILNTLISFDLLNGQGSLAS